MFQIQHLQLNDPLRNETLMYKKEKKKKLIDQ